jgi:MEMO1 family protein
MKRPLMILLFLLLCPATLACASDDLLESPEFQRACLLLSRSALEASLTAGSAPAGEAFPQEFAALRFGVFVTLEMHNRVRGCRGTLYPAYSGLREEIIGTSIGAATRDGRFKPLSRDELTAVRISITIVERLEPLVSLGALSKSDGLVAKSGEKVGVVLPYEGSDAEVRARWALKKAGISDNDDVEWYTLKGVRFAEERSLK